MENIHLCYVLKGEKLESPTYNDVLEAVRIIEEICFEKEINDVTEIKPRMVVVALKKQKKLGKSWAEMKEIMDTAIELAVEEIKKE